jgi:hypothetical protein
MPPGIPFDRAFFEQLLGGAISAFSKEIECAQPLVELLTVDGTTHYVKGVYGVSDAWVALATQDEDHDQPVQMFVPYQTVFRVSIHPCEEHNRKLGFALGQPRSEVLQPQIDEVEAAKTHQPPPPPATTKKKTARKS